MSNLTREQIERIRKDHRYGAQRVDEVCDMALRTHDAEADRDNYRAKFLREREATDEWATRAQRAEAECERLEAALRYITSESGCEHFTTGLGSCYRSGKRKDAEDWADKVCFPCKAHAALATPPPEGEPCKRCNGRGTTHKDDGICGQFPCKRCDGNGNDPDAPHTPHRHTGMRWRMIWTARWTAFTRKRCVIATLTNRTPMPYRRHTI